MTYVLEDTSSLKIEQSVDVSSIRINLKYPTNNFELYTWDYCPVSYKILLALEYKTQAHKDIDFIQHNLPPHQATLLHQKSGSANPPCLKVIYKGNKEEAWIADQYQIIRLLDDAFVQNSLLHIRDEPSLHSEVVLLEDWLNESLLPPYSVLLYQNDLNFGKALKSWLGDEDKLLKRTRLKIFRQEKLWQMGISVLNRNQAYDKAFKRLDEVVLPIITERLELNQARGLPYICGAVPSLADFTLYSFLRLLLGFEEANLVIRRPVLHSFLETFESLPLLSNKGLTKSSTGRPDPDQLYARSAVRGVRQISLRQGNT